MKLCAALGHILGTKKCQFYEDDFHSLGSRIKTTVVSGTKCVCWQGLKEVEHVLYGSYIWNQGAAPPSRKASNFRSCGHNGHKCNGPFAYSCREMMSVTFNPGTHVCSLMQASICMYTHTHTQTHAGVCAKPPQQTEHIPLARTLR